MKLKFGGGTIEATGGQLAGASLAITGAASVGSLSVTAGLLQAAAGVANGISIGTPSGNNDTHLRFQGSATVTNWEIAADSQVGSELNFTPSTAVGGTTFTTAVFRLLTTGASVTGSLSASNGLTVSAGGSSFQAVTVNGQFQQASGAKTSSSQLALFGTTEATTAMQLIVSNSTNAYIDFQAVEQTVGYKPIRFGNLGGSVYVASGLFATPFGAFSGNGAPSSGTSVEIKHDGTTGYVISYDRTGAAYKAIQYAAASHSFNSAVTVTVGGLTVSAGLTSVQSLTLATGQDLNLPGGGYGITNGTTRIIAVASGAAPAITMTGSVAISGAAGINGKTAVANVTAPTAAGATYTAAEQTLLNDIRTRLINFGLYT